MAKASRSARVIVFGVLFLLASSAFITSVTSLSNKGVQFASCRHGPCTNLDLTVGSGIFAALFLLALLVSIFSGEEK